MKYISIYINRKTVRTMYDVTNNYVSPVFFSSIIDRRVKTKAFWKLNLSDLQLEFFHNKSLDSFLFINQTSNKQIFFCFPGFPLFIASYSICSGTVSPLLTIHLMRSHTPSTHTSIVSVISSKIIYLFRSNPSTTVYDTVYVTNTCVTWFVTYKLL